MSLEVEIQLIETEKLLMELLSRFDHAAFVGMMIPVEPDKNGVAPQGITRRWIGNSHCVMGLCEDIKTSVLDSYLYKEKPLEKDEDDD